MKLTDEYWVVRVWWPNQTTGVLVLNELRAEDKTGLAFIQRAAVKLGARIEEILPVRVYEGEAES